jgi:hypothetical protein
MRGEDGEKFEIAVIFSELNDLKENGRLEAGLGKGPSEEGGLAFDPRIGKKIGLCHTPRVVFPGRA